MGWIFIKFSLSNKYVTIFFGTLENKNIKRLNVSFVTKKKQIKSAVKRNKVKRRLRNIMNDLVKKVLNWSYDIKLKDGLSRTYDWISSEMSKDGKNISRFTKS